MGKTFSPAFIKQPWLPSNPTDQCFNDPAIFINGTGELYLNVTLASLYNSSISIANHEVEMAEFWEMDSKAFVCEFYFFRIV